MIVSVLLLLAGLWALTSAVVALPRMVQPYDATPLWFFLSWPLCEIPFFAMAAEVVTGIVLVALGGLDRTVGVVGAVCLVAAWPLLVVLQRRAFRTAGIVDAAIEEAYPDIAPRQPIDKALLRRPFTGPGPRVRSTRDISYGPRGKRNLLDVHAPLEPVSGAPVLVHMHGGAWVVGSKEQQGFPLMNHMVDQGWVCVSVNYGLAPKVRPADSAADIKLAIQWVREHIAEHGGDPSFIAITGGSAGGHLCAMVGLDPEVDVQAMVPFYGHYDWLNTNNVRGRRNNMWILSKVVMGTSPRTDRAGWELVSPLFHTHVDAPPTFVLHGTHDSLLMVEEARIFVAALRAVSTNPVLYCELPGAQHAFDMFNSVRGLEVVEGVGRFLMRVRADQPERAERGPKGLAKQAEV